MILVVDDQPSVRDLVVHVLKDAGFDVIGAKGSHEALARASACDHLALTIVDVMLPRMDGPELARKIREIHPDTSVLFVSGYDLDELLGRGLSLIGGRLLQKPFTPGILLDAVHQTLAERVQRGA